MDPKTVSILGCGWLGLPLARQLIKLGYSVKGSTTSPEKVSRLKQLNIEPYLIHCHPFLEGRRVKFFFLSNILFLNIPFRRNLNDPSYYQEQIESVISFLESSPVKFVIFASSTSVYPESAGLATEDMTIEPDSLRSKVLSQTEQLLLDHDQFKTTIIRFGGLYGPGRKIGGFMAGRKGLPDAHKPVNLIHQDDCVHIVTRIITKDIRGEIFNAVSERHPTNKALYIKAALNDGLEPPQFLDDPKKYYKVVSNAKLKEKLNYVFQHPNPMIF